MSSSPLTFFDYVKAAFHRKVPLPLLGPMPVNQMALGVLAVLGMANPGFWFLGAAAELAYLAAMASNVRFQKLVDAERLLAAQRGWEGRVAATLARLTPPSRERYRRLVGQCRRILGLSATLGEEESLGGFRDLRSRNLNQLLAIFLRLLGSREVIESNVRELDREALERDIAALEKRLAALEGQGDSTLARSLEGTLEIQRKRLQNLERAAENLKVIDSELARIEQQVELIREEAAVSGRPELLSARLDAVTSTMSETSRWMDEHADFLGTLAGDEAAPLADLPPPPPMVETPEEPEEPPPALERRMERE